MVKTAAAERDGWQIEEKVQTDESHKSNKAIGDTQRTTWRQEGEI